MSRVHDVTSVARAVLGNRVLNTCPEFVACTAGIVLVSTPDPSAMFDASTWCS